jgi:hypothetical protein
MPSLRLALLLALLTGAQCGEMSHHMTHASARAGPPVTPVRADYIGTQIITSAPCANGLSCSPSQVSSPQQSRRPHA